jgi:hypothetical protein
MTRRPLPLVVCALLLGACSWGIKLDRAGENVRTVWEGPVTGCREVGTITVSVLDHVGPMDRKDLKVRDELNVLARNEAGGMKADTIAPLGEPRDGEQRWRAYACGAQGPLPDAEPAPAGEGAAETIPLRERH